MRNKKPYLIGITGGTASGKTFVIEALKDYFDGNLLVISQDQYYKNLNVRSLDRWERVNLDEPKAFDNKLLAKHLKMLLKGKQVEMPVYDYTTHKQLDKTFVHDPKNVIVLEGILIYNTPEIRKMLDWKIFLDASPDIRLARRLIRDIEERGIDTQKLRHDIKRYMGTVKPMFDKYIGPMKAHADTVYNTDHGSVLAAEKIIQKVKKIYTRYGIEIEEKDLLKEGYSF